MLQHQAPYRYSAHWMDGYINKDLATPAVYPFLSSRVKVLGYRKRHVLAT